MKAMNFSFICSLIFMIGSLALIHTEPYPKLSFGIPFLDKPRGLEEVANYIVVKYNSDVTFSLEEISISHIVMNGNIMNGTIEIPAGTEIEIHFTSAVSDLYQFFKTKDTNYQKIHSIDLSNLYAPNIQNMSGLFSGCTSLKIVDLSNLNYNNYDLMDVFQGVTDLRILIFSNANMINANNTSSFFSDQTKIRYLDIKGASLHPNLLSSIQSYLNNDFNIICKDEETDLGTDYSMEICCDFKAKTDKCESSNYLKMYFEKSTTYFSGFFDDRSERSEQEIGFILYGDSLLLYNERFTVNDDSIVEIYFRQEESDLSFYFSVDTMISVDFSHFYTRNINGFQGTFQECEFLKTIDLSYVKSSGANNFENFCLKCYNLESCNISHITTKSIENIKSMFSQCSKLKVIDISGLNMENAVSDSAFDGLNSLKYINIKNTTLSKSIIEAIKNLENDLTICQNGPILAKKGFKYSCCSYEDGKEICEVPNSITVYFSEEENNEFLFNQNYIEDIYVISGDSAFTKENITSTIKVDSKMDMFFKSSTITSLEGFFEGASNIVSIDFSNFDLSLVDSFQNMFKDSSLSSIDLSNLNVPSLTNMASMFEGCSGLLYVNLSNFTTSKVNNMGNMFKGCTNLKGLDIHGLNFTSEASSNDLFESFPNLNYLNIKDVEFIDTIKQQFKNIIFAKNKTIVCQNDIETNIFNNKCCNYFFKLEQCESFNFIKVKYKNDSNISLNYNQGFGNKRNGIAY